MTEADRLPPQREPGKVASVALAVFVHLMLAMLLFFGVRWQNRAPDAVEVELYRAAPAPAAVPRPPPPPEPKPRVEPKPEPKPEPRPEPKPAPPPPKPDIALKEKEKPKPPPKEPPKPPPKVEPKRTVKPEPEMRRKLVDEELRRETELLAQQRMQQEAAREAAALREQQAAATASRANAAWTEKIRQKIRGNIVVPPGVSGNPEAVFDVSLLPDGAVLNVRLRKSTGNSALDAAIERAINKSSPLPKPQDPSIFVRDLNLKFRPLEE
jgi:colicin import membrane protein